jgi:hypothetical protein
MEFEQGFQLTSKFTNDDSGNIYLQIPIMFKMCGRISSVIH